MLAEEERERIRRAYYLDHQRVAQIARDTGHCRQTVQRAVEASPRKSYHLKVPRPAPTFKPFQPRLEALLKQNDHLTPKQRYTVHRIFEILREEGYQGCESRIGQFCAEWRRHPSRAESSNSWASPIAFANGALRKRKKAKKAKRKQDKPAPISASLLLSSADQIP